MLRQVCLSLSPTLPNYVSTCSVVCVCLSSLVFFSLSRRLCPSLALSLRRGSRRRSLSDLAVGVQALREFYPTDGFSAAPAFFLGRTEQNSVSLALVGSFALTAIAVTNPTQLQLSRNPPTYLHTQLQLSRTLATYLHTQL